MSFATLEALGSAVKVNELHFLKERGCLHWGRMYVTFTKGENPWGTVTLNVFQRMFRAISSWCNLKFYDNTRFSLITTGMKKLDNSEKISDDILGNLGRLGELFKNTVREPKVVTPPPQVV